MKHTLRFVLSSFLLVFIAVHVSAQTTEFTYQGSLKNSGVAANGNYDFEFALYDAVSGGAQIGSTLTRSTIAVADGNFSVKLDFGSVFPGAGRFLEIRVRPSGGGAFTPLTPRQAVSNAPYSVKSLNADNAASSATATNALQLGGIGAGQYVLTTDPRLSDARIPTAGSTNYVQNTVAQQAASNFNISGTGKASILEAATQFNLGAGRFAATPTSDSTVVGILAGETATGFDSSFYGYSAGRTATGPGNSFFGKYAGRFTTSGGANAFFGFGSGAANGTGLGNTFFGYSSGNFNETGSYNSAFGFQANVDPSDLTNATAIGAFSRVNQSNSIVLGSINGVGIGTADTNVGIGTTAPAHRLHVVGNGLFTGNLTVNGTLTATLPGGSGSYIQNTNSPQVSSSFNITGDGVIGGSLGVGTSPVFRADVFSPGDKGLRVGINTVSGTVAQFGYKGSFLVDLDGIPGGRFSISENGNVGIGVVLAQQRLHVGGNGAFNGSLGVGMQNPQQRLSVSDGVNIDQNAANDGTLLNTLRFGSTSGEAIGSKRTAGGNQFGIDFYTNSTSRMSISNVGRIGLGTSEPIARLDVRGDITVGTVDAAGLGLDLNNTLWMANDAGDAKNSFRLDGYQNNLYVIGRSASGAASGAGIIFRTSSAGQGESDRVFINPDGSVRLAVVPGGGSIATCFGASNLISYCSSSKRYKSNIASFTPGLDLIRRLRPVSFNWKDGGMRDMGLVAEDVNAVEPLLTTTNDNGEVEGVKYDRVGVVLVNAVREQQEQIEAQQKQIDEQRSVIKCQAARLDRQQAEIDALKSLVCGWNASAPVCRGRN